MTKAWPFQRGRNRWLLSSIGVAYRSIQLFMATQATHSHRAESSKTFALGGDLNVRRLGYGAMRLTGDGIWVHPRTRKKRSEFCGAPLSLA